MLEVILIVGGPTLLGTRVGVLNGWCMEAAWILKHFGLSGL